MEKIGDSYHWQRSGSSGLAAGFFYDYRRARCAVLTLTPAPEDITEDIDVFGLLCFVPCVWQSLPFNLTQDETFFVDEVFSGPLPFGAECLLVGTTQVHSAKIVGTHQTVSLDGETYSNLYALETNCILDGMAGAAIIYQGQLCGILAGNGGQGSEGKNIAFFCDLADLDKDRWEMLVDRHHTCDFIYEDTLSKIAHFRGAA